ncbi:MAG: TolB family protein [Bacteroidales bacterium]
MKHSLIIILAGLVLFSCQKEKEQALTGLYLGQNLPGDSAELFAPGIVSTGMSERDIAIYPDGSEIYFCRNIGNHKFATIFYSKQVDGKRKQSEVLEFCRNPNYTYIEPFISPDGDKLFFVSNMNEDGGKPRSADVWVSERLNGHWDKPSNLGEPVNSDKDEYFPSITNDGTLYLTKPDESGREYIFRYQYEEGKYVKGEKLIEHVNCGVARYNALISPDESFIIVPAFGMDDSFGGTDYYIVFRNENDEWSKPVNMNEKINSANPCEWSAAFSPDRKYLFFMSARGMTNNQLPPELNAKTFHQRRNSPQNGNSDIYWIKADFIDELKKKAVF